MSTLPHIYIRPTNMNVLKLQREELARAGEGLFGPRVPEVYDEAAVDAARTRYADMTVKDLRALSTERMVFPDHGPDARATKKADYVTALARDDVKKAIRDARYAAAYAADEAENAQREILRAQVEETKRRRAEDVAKLKARAAELERITTKDAITTTEDTETLRNLALNTHELATCYKKLIALVILGAKIDSIEARI
jgi:hypothetical protein